MLRRRNTQRRLIISPLDDRNRNQNPNPNRKPQSKPARRFNLKSKSFWAAPAAIAVITLHRYLDWQIPIPLPQTWLSNSVAAAIARQASEPETIGYIALAAAFFAYWCAKENCPAAIKELVNMGIAAYFRQIKEEVIADAIAKGVAEGEAKAEARGEARGEANGRELAISELRAMPRHEALALLERQDTNTDADAESDSEPESPSSRIPTASPNPNPPAGSTSKAKASGPRRPPSPSLRCIAIWTGKSPSRCRKPG